MQSTLTNFSNFLESNLKMNGTLDYISNVLEKNLKKYKKPVRNPKQSRIRNHLIQVCRANTQLDLSVEGSYFGYKSMFVKVVKIEETYGFLIDMLMPREGNYRMDAETKVTFSYSHEETRYKFESSVIRYVEAEFPAYFIALPKAIKNNEKRMYYRMPTTVTKPLSLERTGDRIRNAIIRNSKVLDFTSDGLCLLLPPVEGLKNGKKFLSETLKQIKIRLPDSTTTLPFDAACCHLSNASSSNGLICGIRFVNISPSDKAKLTSLYYQRQHDVRVA